MCSIWQPTYFCCLPIDLHNPTIFLMQFCCCSIVSVIINPISNKEHGTLQARHSRPRHSLTCALHNIHTHVHTHMCTRVCVWQNVQLANWVKQCTRPYCQRESVDSSVTANASLLSVLSPSLSCSLAILSGLDAAT